MPTSNPNIKTIADYSATDGDRENDSPNIRTTNEQSLSSYIAKEKSSSSLIPSATSTNGRKGDYYNATTKSDIPVYCIPTFANTNVGTQLLQRVVSEFMPIIQRRQYNVLSISELCCCADGLDSSHRTARHRKIRKVANNILGYNRTTWGYNSSKGKQHTIHIRLRYPNHHESSFYSYEDVAGTLAHELSHCMHSNHDAKFFQLMDEIIDEHAQLMAYKTMYGTIPFAGHGQTLGSTKVIAPASSSTNKNGTIDDPNRSGFGRGHVLGGDRTFVQWMTPNEVAVIAAETRRRQQLLRNRANDCCGSSLTTMICPPCNDTDNNYINPNNDTTRNDDHDYYIDVLDDEDDDDAGKKQETKQNPSDSTDRNVPIQPKSDDSKMPATKRTASVSTILELTPDGSVPNNLNYIDLTVDSSDDDATCHTKTKKLKNERHYDISRKNDVSIIATNWMCHRCTYRNTSSVQICDMCATAKS